MSDGLCYWNCALGRGGAGGEGLASDETSVFGISGRMVGKLGRQHQCREIL
jgi:hypothetical protein